MDDLQNGVGASPDGSASAGTPDEVSTAPELATPEQETTDESKIISEPSDQESPEAELSDDLQSEMESVIEANPNDSELIKKLRTLVKTKYEDYSSRVQPELTPQQKDALDLVNGLFEFDTETGTPTTRNFAQKIAQKDVNLAAQAFDDLAMVPIDSNGFTIGHKFLEKIGLDPYKIEELRQFSRGEINPTDYGIVAVHEGVPKELAEAYKSLDPVTRTDVDLYLDSENESQKMAAMRTLRNQQAVIDNDRYRQESEYRQQAQFNNEVMSSVEGDLQTTYSGVLNSLKTNPAYTNVTISSDKNVDAMVKDSVIAQLNALGDPRSVLAQQAVATLESQGVKVDVPKIEQLMNTIESSAKIAISAEKMGKLQGRDYSTQIQDALARKSAAVSSLIAIGNKYFSQVLANLTKTKTNTPSPKGGIPSLKGSNQAAPNRPAGVKSMAELDAEILNIAKGLQAGTQ